MQPMRRVARRLPGVGDLLRRLERTREERDRLRDERDRLRRRLEVETRAREEAQQRVPRLGEPSFFASYESMKRRRKLAEEQAGTRHPIWRANSKTAGRHLAASVGVAVPQVLAGPTPIDELTLPDAARMVLKPVSGASRRGVHPLVRDRDGGLRSVYDASPRSWEQLREELLAMAAEGRVSRAFLVEELIPGHTERTLPYDFKCYCIGGEVELVMQMDTHDRRDLRRASFKFWSPQFRDLGPVRHAERVDPDLPAPRDPAGLVAAARRIATALPGPFVRVDLFDGPRGPVFSEITPHPGGRQLFDPPVDRALGESWEAWEATRLAAELRAPTDDAAGG